MAQVSRKQLSREVWESLWQAWVATVDATGGSRQAAGLFNGLLTETEKIVLTKRLVASLLILAGWSPYRISRKLHLSLSTSYKLQELLKRDESYRKLLLQVMPGSMKQKPKLKLEGISILEFLDDVFAGYRDRGRLWHGKIPEGAR
jgi:hypothetical protein